MGATIMPLNLRDFMLFQKNLFDPLVRSMKAKTVYEYKNHIDIPDTIAETVKSVAGVDDISDESLSDINSFLNGLEKHLDNHVNSSNNKE
tara:strand:- start:197 stop:466 length:270 start_codon:yes stop_codon:yes gene_type:complete